MTRVVLGPADTNILIAQRPCSRCLSNGKEDACVDVQHKKRGRPRLRDDSHRGFEARFPHPAEQPIRRPVSLYSPANVPPAFEDPLRRSQSYRVLKSHPNEPMPPRHIERGSAADANVFPPPLSIPQRVVEPVAFLTTELEFAKVSTSFVEAVGSQPILGRRLMEVVNVAERDRVIALQRVLQDEQGRKEPNYLPPIFGKQETERVIQSLPFSPESISRFQLDRQEYLTFATPDGQQRSFAVRIGLAKEDSIYFVVMWLAPRPQAFPHPPSPHRDWAYSGQSQPYTQLTPVSASFGPMGPRPGESPRATGYMARPPGTPGPIMPAPSPGISPIGPSYAAAPAQGRGEHHPVTSYQIPRSELSSRASQSEYQLPPIRHQPQGGSSSGSGWPREERGGRVDIGGLIEKPDTSRPPPP